MQGETPSEVSVAFIDQLRTSRMDLRCDINNLQLLELNSGHKTRVNKTVNLYSYLRFRDNIMCTMSSNNNLRLIEAARMDVNSFDILNDGNFTLFAVMGGAVGPHGGQMKN